MMESGDGEMIFYFGVFGLSIVLFSAICGFLWGHHLGRLREPHLVRKVED